jgi:hypothetical protein
MESGRILSHEDIDLVFGSFRTKVLDQGVFRGQDFLGTTIESSQLSARRHSVGNISIILNFGQYTVESKFLIELLPECHRSSMAKIVRTVSI